MRTRRRTRALRRGPGPPAGARALGGVGALAIALGAAACGGASSAAPLPPRRVLQVNARTRTVDLLLEASENDAFGGFNFDGYGDGAMTVHVPLGWRVEVTCTNESTAFTHSCAVVRDQAITTSGGTVVFGAASPDPTTGLGFGRTARYSFDAAVAGRYRIACLVTAHEVDGMWDWLVVSPGGRPDVTT